MSWQVRHPRTAVAAALRAYRAEMEQALLGLAYARRDTSGTILLSRSPSDHPIGYQCPLGLDDPGNWQGLWRVSCHSRTARLLRSFGFDTGVVALAELLRVERADVGPDTGPLRWCEAGSPAWQSLYAQARMLEPAPLWRRAGQELEKHRTMVPHAVCELWRELQMRLLHDGAHEGVKLAVLPLPATSLGVTARAKNPCPILGAPGWGVRAGIGVTDHGWTIIVQLEWLAGGRAPNEIPTFEVALGPQDDSSHDRVRFAMPAARTGARFASDAPLSGTVMLWAQTLAAAAPVAALEAHS